jgi:hypothetical protein
MQSESQFTDPENTARQLERRKMSGWTFVALAGTAFVVLLFGLIGLMALLVKPAAPKLAAGVVGHTLRDGTILVVEHVSAGTRHDFTRELPGAGGAINLFSNLGSSYHSTTHITQDNAIVVWMSRRDPLTGQPLDFDWWKKTVAVDENGWEVEDGNPSRISYTRNGSSGIGGSRPFARLAPDNYSGIVVHSEFPMLRATRGKIHLTVYDDLEEIVGEFDVSVPATGVAIPAWNPQPVPITRRDGDLSVRLASLELREDHYDDGQGEKRRHVQFSPRFEFTRDDVPAPEWSLHSVDWFDPLGNRGSTWSPRLSPFEAAWKIELKAWRGPDATFDPTEEWHVTGLKLPAAGAGEAIGQSQLVQGALIDLVALGDGAVRYTDRVTSNANGTSSYTGFVEQASFDISVGTDSGVRTTTISTEMSHLIVRVARLSEDDRLLLRVKDDQGRSVPAQEAQVGDRRFYMLSTAHDAQSLDVTVIVSKSRRFEFFVAPPEELKPVKQPAAGATSN